MTRSISDGASVGWVLANDVARRTEAPILNVTAKSNNVLQKGVAKRKEMKD